MLCRICALRMKRSDLSLKLRVSCSYLFIYVDCIDRDSLNVIFKGMGGMRKPNIGCLNHTFRGPFELRPCDHCFKVPEPSCKNIVCSLLTFWSHPIYESHISSRKSQVRALNDTCWHVTIKHSNIRSNPCATLGEHFCKNLAWILEQRIGWERVCVEVCSSYCSCFINLDTTPLKGLKANLFFTLNTLNSSALHLYCTPITSCTQ